MVCSIHQNNRTAHLLDSGVFWCPSPCWGQTLPSLCMQVFVLPLAVSLVAGCGRSGTKTGEGKQFALVFRPSSSLKVSTSSNMFAKKMAHTSRWPFDLGYTEWLMLEQDWVSASWVSGSIKNPTEEQVHRFDHETAG